jgi:hypothetical protein
VTDTIFDGLDGPPAARELLPLRTPHGGRDAARKAVKPCDGRLATPVIVITARAGDQRVVLAEKSYVNRLLKLFAPDACSVW